jgi:hypothetical protein
MVEELTVSNGIATGPSQPVLESLHLIHKSLVAHLIDPDGDALFQTRTRVDSCCPEWVIGLISPQGVGLATGRPNRGSKTGQPVHL